jgi:hypothetical protein
MLNPADLQLSTMYFKSFNPCLCFLSSNYFNFKSFADEKAALEACHQDYVCSVDVAKQLDERDATHKTEVEQLKSQIAELLEVKEQKEGQLKKTQDLLATAKAETSTAKTELEGLKEQATKWEVDVARLNVNFASKLQIIVLIFCPRYIFKS